MGILHNSQTNEEKVFKDYEKLLANDEKIVIAYKLIRDLIIVTNFRIILIDKQGVTGRKKMITSYPLSRIVRYEIENSPYLDIDSEVDIYFAGQEKPVKFELTKGSNVFEFCKILTEQLMK
jgi:hypothetical protein